MIRAFLLGVASVLDLFGVLSRPQHLRSDAQVIHEDWVRVGQDLDAAMRRYEREEGP